MIQEDARDQAIQEIRTTPPLSECGLEDVLHGPNEADVQLRIPDLGVSDIESFFEDCISAVEDISGESFELTVRSKTPHEDSAGHLYFQLTIRETE